MGKKDELEFFFLTISYYFLTFLFAVASPQVLQDAFLVLLMFAVLIVALLTILYRIRKKM